MAKQLFDRFRSASGPRQGGASRITTAMFEMQLDHDSGELTGTVLIGEHAGALLADLDQQQLMGLMAESQATDAQSAAVLAAYLDRRLGTDWRNGAQAGKTLDPNSSHMSASQAQEILGLSPQATRNEIISAHKKLIQKLHPDRGGSNYLAIMVNQARDFLLKHL